MINKEKEIRNLQRQLSSIRKIAGWTLEELGNKIGVTKQTVSNLENFKTKMTQTQYIAIRSVLDYEIKTNKENIVLPKIVELLLNQTDKYSEKEYDEMSKNVEDIASSVVGGVAGTIPGAIAGGTIGLLGGNKIGTEIDRSKED
jgi:transcriptional regulator with XRE-family HTH domain